VDEAWYQERIAICAPCEYNSKNVPEEDLTFLDKRLCGSGPRCTACGCCTDLKTSVKTESCGLTVLGKQPKWVALEVEGEENVSIVNTDTTVKTTRAGKEFLIDFGGSKEKVLRFDFTLTNKAVMLFSKWAVACGCTHVENIEQINDATMRVTGTVSTLGFRTGLNEKTLTIEYKTRFGKYKIAAVRFRVIKL
jgi:hypothetical protein